MEQRPTEEIAKQINGNMLPQLRRTVLRQDFPSVDDLIDETDRAERTLEKEQGYRIQVPASSAIVPDAACGCVGQWQVEHQDSACPTSGGCSSRGEQAPANTLQTTFLCRLRRW